MLYARANPRRLLKTGLLAVLAMSYLLTDELAERDRERGLLRAALPAAVADFLLPEGTRWDAPLDASAAPAQPLRTLLAGQPMLMSQTSAPSSSTTSAARAMVVTSEP